MIIRCYFVGMNSSTHAEAAAIQSAHPSAIFYNVTPDFPIVGVSGAIFGIPARLHRGFPCVFIDTDDGLQEHTRLEVESVTTSNVATEVAAVSGGQRPPYAIPMPDDAFIPPIVPPTGIADGMFLKREGDQIVGVEAPSGGGLTQAQIVARVFSKC